MIAAERLATATVLTFGSQVIEPKEEITAEAMAPIAIQTSPY